MFYFDFGNYFTMLRLAWNEKVPRARFHYLAVLVLAVPVVASFHALCFWLDRWLFPELRNVEMKAPIFIVGHARSGTTLTHRLMSRDAERFSSFRLYELYFPSLLQKKTIRAVARLDERFLAGSVAKRVQRWEDWRYGSMRHMHHMGLTEPEEDDIVLYYSMGAGFWITKMPYMGDLDFFHMNDWPAAKRRRVNDFYRECVLRQLCLNGAHKTHLSKNPLYSGRVASLIEAFPDARFVVNVRHPYEAIPSNLKLVWAGWKRLGWDEERQKHCLDVLAGTAFATYRHPFEALEAHPEVPRSIVDYRALTADPAAAIERIYADLGLPMTDGFRAQLAAEGTRQRKHATRHRYSLAQFGLDPGLIQRELAELFERFDWEVPDGDARESPEEGAG